MSLVFLVIPKTLTISVVFKWFLEIQRILLKMYNATCETSSQIIEKVIASIKIFITALCVTFLMTAVITFEPARKAVHADEANGQDNTKCL